MQTGELGIKMRYIESGDVDFFSDPGKIMVFEQVRRPPPDHSQQQDFAEMPGRSQPRFWSSRSPRLEQRHRIQHTPTIRLIAGRKGVGGVGDYQPQALADPQSSSPKGEGGGGEDQPLAPDGTTGSSLLYFLIFYH